MTRACADDRADALDALDAVLERNDHAAGGERGFTAAAASSVSQSLTANSTKSNCPSDAGVGASERLGQMHVAEGDS